MVWTNVYYDNFTRPNRLVCTEFPTWVQVGRTLPGIAAKKPLWIETVVGYTLPSGTDCFFFPHFCTAFDFQETPIATCKWETILFEGERHEFTVPVPQVRDFRPGEFPINGWPNPTFPSGLPQRWFGWWQVQSIDVAWNLYNLSLFEKILIEDDVDGLFTTRVFARTRNSLQFQFQSEFRISDNDPIQPYEITDADREELLVHLVSTGLYQEPVGKWYADHPVGI